MFNLITQALVFIMLSLPAAADYVVQVIDLKNDETQETKTVLHVKGDFDLGISDDIHTALKNHSDIIDEVVLNSLGGLGYEGYKTGAILSEYGLPTRVAKGTYCLSACAVAFIGGTNYVIDDGILGFHKGHLAGKEPFMSQDEAFDNGQQAGTYNAYFILANGFSIDLALAIDKWSDPNNFVVFTTTEDLNKFYVRSEEDKIIDYLGQIGVTPLVFGPNEMVKHLENNPNEGKWKVTNVISRVLNPIEPTIPTT